MPELRLSQGSVPYQIHRRARRTVGVVVRPDGRVDVLAPRRASLREIRKVLEEFRAWIERKRREALERARRRRMRRFDDGDVVPYLGDALRLSVVETGRAPAPAVAVVREGSTLTVSVAAGLAAEERRRAVRAAVRRWMLGEACEVFHRRHVAMARRVGTSAQRVVIKDMTSRWGSCGPSRRMNLNWRLVLAPERVLDYVLVHELTHIEVPNHSRAFWRRVRAACEHAAESRKWLRVHGDDLDL